MPPNIKYGLGSSRLAKPWLCVCGRANWPTRHLIFMLPKDRCDCGRKFTGDFRISFDDIKVNGHYLLGKVHRQGKKPRCVAYAYVHGLQFKERLEAVIMKHDPSLLMDLEPKKLNAMFTVRCPGMPEKSRFIKGVRDIRMVHMALILKEDGLIGPEPNVVHRVDDIIVIPRDDFRSISIAIADGATLVTTFYSGKKLRGLKYGQIYKSYRAPKYRGNKRKRTIGHAVCLIGAARKNKEEYFDFVNSYKFFCRRRNSRGIIVKSGFGRLRASDLKTNVIRLCRGITPGENEWRLQPQNETVLNAHNKNLMRTLKRQIANQLDIDDQLDIDGGMEFEDFDNHLNVSHGWKPAEIKPHMPGKRLSVEKVRCQFLVNAGPCGEVYTNDAEKTTSDPVYQMQYRTCDLIQWSPLGTHLVTVDRQGALMWGGDDKFACLMSFGDQQVKLVDFSPGERYLVTYSSYEPSPMYHTNMVVLHIFDVRSGKMMLDFKGTADEFTRSSSVGVYGISWPIFRWGGGRDDKYFAKLGKNVISVYETETFSLLDKEPLKIDNVADFSWSPTEPILSCFVPELGGGKQPARVSLVRIPGKLVMRQKILSNASNCKMHWQHNGEYLAVQVERYAITKDQTSTGFELFRIRERGIPIEFFELDNKNDKIIAFAWEPKGHRFAVIHGDGDISFYTVRTTNNLSCVCKLTTLNGRQANALFWSPAGRFIVLAGLKDRNGQMEFYNLDDLETMAVAEHKATDVMWDPTGRFLATVVTSVHEMGNGNSASEMGTGFQVWSFDGKQICKVSKDQLYQKTNTAVRLAPKAIIITTQS
ncbi:eukaryotic translation initiation factor 3 subunit B-like isoform X2 [Hordeum vulgare subsp. vulgare]|uniref:Translation initiation factor beta propellor-like domain-containing protein n=2 Tax=Hordeum vulgare subsp. vulgare TaxID=112509 RepID=A0A8I7BDM4_HORVV|nr:eukaryotic translation initiation factor 3 subunit B-like isoform X2 [Hordeum vulgare subsp. vulgare]